MFDLTTLSGILGASKYAESGGQLSNSRCKNLKQEMVDFILKKLRSGIGQFVRIDRASTFSKKMESLDSAFAEIEDEGTQGDIDVCVVPGSNQTIRDEYDVIDERLGHVKIEERGQKMRRTQHTRVFTQPFVLRGKYMVASYLDKIGYNTEEDCKQYVGCVQDKIEECVAHEFEKNDNQAVMILIPTCAKKNNTKDPKWFKQIKKSIREFVRPKKRQWVDRWVRLIGVPVMDENGFMCTSRLAEECTRATLHGIDTAWVEFTGGETSSKISVLIVAAQSWPLPTSLLVLERLAELKTESSSVHTLQLSIKLLVDPHDFQIRRRHFHPFQVFHQLEFTPLCENAISIPRRLCCLIQKQESNGLLGDMTCHLPVSVPSQIVEFRSTFVKALHNCSCIQNYPNLAAALDVPSVRKYLLSVASKTDKKTANSVWTFSSRGPSVNVKPTVTKKKRKKFQMTDDDKVLHLRMLAANPFVDTAQYEAIEQSYSIEKAAPVCDNSASMRDQVIIESINSQALPFDLVYSTTSFETSICILILEAYTPNNKLQLSHEEIRLQTTVAIYSLLARLNEIQGTPILYVIGEMPYIVQYGRAELRQLQTIAFK